MNARELIRRLEVAAGQSEAFELLSTPNFSLGGKSPQDLLDAGDFAPVEILVREIENRAKCRRDFIRNLAPEFDEIDEISAEPILDRLPSRRHSKETDRLFGILDSLEGRAK